MKILDNNKYLISPSLLAADFYSLPETLKALEKTNLKYIHYDVMDNHFVPQLTFGYKFVNDFNKKTKLKSDVHLMIEEPWESVKNYLNADSDIVTFHYEAVKNNDFYNIIEKIHNAGKFVGVSLKPATSISVLEPFIEIIDLVLIMTVEPGFAGQTMIEACLPKINGLRELIEKKNLELVIQADGGINLSNIKDLYNRGCSFFVMGSAFFKQDNFEDFIKKVDDILLK